MTLREQGRVDEALAAIEAALVIARDAGNAVWLAHWLVEYARVLRTLGRPAEALEPLHEAATRQRAIGDRSRETMPLPHCLSTVLSVGPWPGATMLSWPPPGPAGPSPPSRISSGGHPLTER